MREDVRFATRVVGQQEAEPAQLPEREAREAADGRAAVDRPHGHPVAKVAQEPVRRCSLELENGNAPSVPSLPRSERDAMEEFLGPLTVLLGSLGFNALQPVSARPQPAIEADSPLSGRPLFFTQSKRPISARGASTDEGFVVFEGSRGDAQIRSSLGKGYLALRLDLIGEGAIVEEGDTIRFVRDVLFSSPSAAAAILAGGAYNGREAWRDAQGVTLKELEDQLSARADVEEP